LPPSTSPHGFSTDIDTETQIHRDKDRERGEKKTALNFLTNPLCCTTETTFLLQNTNLLPSPLPRDTQQSHSDTSSSTAESIVVELNSQKLK
jgi:hypothetical protein